LPALLPEVLWQDARPALLANALGLAEPSEHFAIGFLERSSQIFSSYRTAAGDELWIITDNHFSITTILLPKEYWDNLGFQKRRIEAQKKADESSSKVRTIRE